MSLTVSASCTSFERNSSNLLISMVSKGNTGMFGGLERIFSSGSKILFILDWFISIISSFALMLSTFWVNFVNRDSFKSIAHNNYINIK